MGACWLAEFLEGRVLCKKSAAAGKNLDKPDVYKRNPMAEVVRRLRLATWREPYDGS